MNIRFLTFLLFTFCYTTLLFAQDTYVIKGTTIDTVSKEKLRNMTVCVLNARDSTLEKFVYSKNDGTFSVKNLRGGNYILMISYPNYIDYIEKFTLNGTRLERDFGSINVAPKARFLQEIIIKSKVQAIKLKGDTTEYNAKAFVIQPNDKVEDLLKQLPGIQVDQNGKITAQGQTVTKVLLDGEEFFGDDPTLVTKNIRADMVDKVQLYDKKSDQAAFTGVDDGKKTKTINIILKEDKKNGVFGKLNGGLGTNSYYEGQAIYNRFKGNTKFATYGTLANDGKTGLVNADNNKIGAGSVEIGDASLIRTASGADALNSYSGNYDGKGTPLTRSGGAHYDNKWAGNGQSINLNYQIGSIEVTGINTNTIQQSLPTSLINTNVNETYNNYAFRQKLDATYQIKIDTTSTFKISAVGARNNYRTNDRYLTTGNGKNDILLNAQNRSITSSGNKNEFAADALYTKKFKKQRRTFSWEISENYNQSQADGYLNSGIDFYNSLGTKDSTETVNQYKTSDVTNSALNSNITYSEPLSKAFSLGINYGLGINNSTANKKSFNQAASGSFDILDNIYSSNYQFTQLTNQLGAIVNFSKGKTLFNFGTKTSYADFEQIDKYTGSNYKRNFINWAPQAFYSYQYSQFKSFSFFYTGRTTQPSIDQIQPVRTNTDPLNVTLGNSKLDPSYSNNFDLTYRLNNILTGQNMYLSVRYLFTTNSISSNVSTDAISGKTAIQYINLSGNSPYTYSVFADMSKTFSRSETVLSLNPSITGNVFYNYINAQLNRSGSTLYSISVGIAKSKKNKYNLSAFVQPNYSINTFSLQPQINNDAFGINSRVSGRIFLPLKLQISSVINNSYTEKTQAFDAQSKTIWNAAFSKTFLKDDNLKFSISGNDLLDQNSFFNRSVSGNTITQSASSTIRRYFMFSITWDFTKFGTIAVKN